MAAFRVTEGLSSCMWDSTALNWFLLEWIMVGKWQCVVQGVLIEEELTLQVGVSKLLLSDKFV